MTSHSSCATFSFTLSLILWHCVLISAQDTTAPVPTSTLVPHGNQQQVTVGWVNNPKRRGTLTIIIDCLTTIFACTWTVLHLNVPARGEPTTTRVLRKVKWMAITILFPEFIFVKAVCELRFALYTLDKMYRSVHKSPQSFWNVSKVEGTGRSFWDHWTWIVEFGSLKIWLYKLLLRRTPLAGLMSRGYSTQEQIHEEYLPGPMFGRRLAHNWTLTHAYYANMGGIVAREQKKKLQSDIIKPMIDYEYSVVRGEHFSGLTAWRFGHPLKELRLSVKDIKDKSKADWIVKTIAIIQIGRLILDLITRSIGGQPVTQLEIATASFAVFAIVTYLANWWKPKDITQPTAIHFAVVEENLAECRTEQFFVPRLCFLSYCPDGYADTMFPSSRIEDDELWMDKSNLSWAWSLIVGSCLVFGGIHCTAWSFWFPTRVEQIAWQTAALVSTILPMIAWAGLFLPYLYKSRGLRKKLAEAIEKTIESFGTDLLCANDDWWNTFTTAVNSPEWDDWIRKHHFTTSEKNIRRLKWELETMGKLRSLLRDLWRSKEGGRRREGEEIMNTIWKTGRDLKDFMSVTYALRDQYETWIREQDAFLYGTLPEDPELSAIYKEWVQMLDFKEKIPLWENWLEMQNAQKEEIPWVPRRDYYYRYSEPAGVFRWIYYRCKIDMEPSEGQYRDMWRDFDIKVQSLNTVAAILYTVARLVILAIMFSSLRAAPDGVYDTPDWTRFMPSFS